MVEMIEKGIFKLKERERIILPDTVESFNTNITINGKTLSEMGVLATALVLYKIPKNEEVE